MSEAEDEVHVRGTAADVFRYISLDIVGSGGLIDVNVEDLCRWLPTHVNSGEVGGLCRWLQWGGRGSVVERGRLGCGEWKQVFCEGLFLGRELAAQCRPQI